jgi:apolipoprotein N-acyltransferase
MALQNKISRLVFPFLAGTLFAAAFPKFNLPVLAWVAPGLVLWLTYNDSGKRTFLSGLLAGFGCCLVMVYWLLLIPFRWYGLAAYLGQCSVGAAYIGVWCWLCWQLWPGRKTERSSSADSAELPRQWLAMSRWDRFKWPLLCAVAWVAIEMTLGRVLTGFPWFLGASQFRWLSLIQISSYTGVYGVSFLVTWLSVSLFCTVLSWPVVHCRLRLVLLQIVPPLLGLAGVLAFGWHELSSVSEPSRRLKLALVQPAIPQQAIWDRNEETNRFLKLLELSQAALAEKPDLLVWPETALPKMITRDQFTQDAIVNLLKPYNTWMVLGASDYESKPGASGPDATAWFNAAFLINPAGQMVARYHKRHLVPFGEFMPGALWFPPLARLRVAGAGLTAGNRPGLFHITKPMASFSVLICYEDLFPQEVRQCQDQQTDFLLNLTNDGWFGDSAVQWLHTVNALIRTVELHLPLVRCCNNGITCWIDSCGRLHNVYFPESKNVYQAGYKLIEVPLAGPESAGHPTFYRQHGDFFGWGCVGLVAIAGSKELYLRRTARRANARKAVPQGHKTPGDALPPVQPSHRPKDCKH